MKSMQTGIVILAAGKGSRMHSLTPKVLQELCGKPMLWHIITQAKRLSNDITVVLGHQKERVAAYIKEHFDSITLIYQDTSNYPGTGGALLGYKPKQERILILNGDMPLVTAKSLRKLLEPSSDITLAMLDLEDPHGYGRVIVENDRVCAIVEQKDATKEQLNITTVNAGVYLIKASLLARFIPRLTNDNAQGEYYLTDILAMAKQEGCSIVAQLVDSREFMGVNTKKDLAKAEELLAWRIKEEWMLRGVGMQLPETIYIQSDVVFEGECFIEQGCRITGCSYIKNSHIKAHSVIEDSKVVDSSIGPLAHLRPKSHLVKSHVGNFVEVKNSTLEGVKAGHLSYLGDAAIGSGSNIGAGVITCNYDGKQ